MICAGFLDGSGDSCFGDSGGGLICAQNETKLLIGIVSFGRGCGRRNYPGVYAQITSVRDWIKLLTSV